MNDLIPISKPCFIGNEKKYIVDCIDTGWISSAGSFIEKFENINADLYGSKNAVAVSNGTVALHLALETLGIGKQDEVIVPDLTFAATANTVIHAGAKPILADISADSWTIDIDKCDNLITKNTKAIIPVHLYGQPCNMDKIMDFAKDHDIYVIEDCAESHGAEYKGQKVGTFGDIGCFSFYGNKIITTGEGGICLTNDSNLNERMRVLRDHGMRKNQRYWHDIVGYNYRMTNMQAAIGVAQMEKFDELSNARIGIEKKYNKLLSKHPYITLQNNFTDRKKVCWLYSILLNTEKIGKTVKEIQNDLKIRNIGSRPFFNPLHKMPLYKYYKHNSIKKSIKISKKGINLPTFYELSDSKIQYISNNLKNIIGKE